MYAWNWQSAEENFRRAIAANTTYPTGHHWYGDFLAGRGRFRESLDQMKRAHELDPLSQQIGIEWGWVYYLMHQTDSAEAHIRQTLALNPNYAQGHWRLGLVQIQRGRYAEAIGSIQRAIDLGVFQPHAAGGLACAQAMAGHREVAFAIVNDLKRRASRELIPPFDIAAAYAGLGDPTQGIAWLNRGIDEKDVYIPENFFEPLLDPLRSDSRFSDILKRMGLKPAP